MSATIITKNHVDVLVTAGLRNQIMWLDGCQPHQLSEQNTSRVGRMLWDENIRSVQARFPAKACLPGPYVRDVIAEGVAPIELPAWIARYEFSKLATTPLQVLKALDCYEYQSCEHDGWFTSEAYAFCDALRRAVIAELPGYETADWMVG